MWMRSLSVCVCVRACINAWVSYTSNLAVKIDWFLSCVANKLGVACLPMVFLIWWVLSKIFFLNLGLSTLYPITKLFQKNKVSLMDSGREGMHVHWRILCRSFVDFFCLFCNSVILQITHFSIENYLAKFVSNVLKSGCPKYILFLKRVLNPA